MSFLFGGKAPQQESGSKAALREVRGASRRMQREDGQAEREEQALLARLKVLAAGGKLDECKTQATQLMRLRAHRRAAHGMQAHLQDLAQQLSTVQSTGVMFDTVAKTAKLLAALNAKMDPKGMHSTLRQFEREQCRLVDGTEVLTETLDAAFEAQDEDAGADDAMTRILQEIGLDVAPLQGVPISKPILDADLEARLERLRTM